MSALWIALILAAVGCYLLKLAGVSLPQSALNHPAVQRTASLLPVAMLAALIAVQLFDSNDRYHVDWHTLAGVAAAAIALRFRQGLLVVFLVAIGVTAVLRALS